MTNLATYLPQDRRRALAQGQTLPDRAHGSVLFADISGFTLFTVNHTAVVYLKPVSSFF